MNRKRRPFSRRRFPACEQLEIRSLLAADLLITEFMANNDNILVDEDGDSTDWIEIHNPSSEDADLSDWYLTDDASEPDKWSFPSQQISAGSFLVVYASGKDRATPGQPLHTNFSLDANGEYLALSRRAPTAEDPNAVEVVSAFAPEFPQQVANVSYGIGQNVEIETVMAATDVARVLFPQNDSLGTDWTQPSFDDSSWTSATNSIGYESAVPGFTVQDAKSTGTISNIAQAQAVLNGSGVQSETIDITPVVNFHDAGGGGGTGNFGNPAPFPNDTGADDNDFAIRATGTILVPRSGTWTFGTNSDDGVRLWVDGNLVIDDDALHGPENHFGQASLSAGAHEIELIFFERGGGAEVELFAAEGSYTTFNRTAFQLIGDTQDGGLPVHTVPGATGGASGEYSPYITTDVDAAMKGATSSAYLRSPFFVVSPDTLASLSMRVRYDDGFVAYLNGTEVARRNAPAEIAFDSTAMNDRPTSSAVLNENIDLSQHLGLLNAGINVLAVHALNDAVDSDEFLLSVELAEIDVTENASVYFTEPTPGDFNAATGVEGFLLDEIQWSHPHGFYDEPFSLEISTLTDGTTVRYTTDGTEPTESHGSLYNGPISITGTQTIRARAFKQDQNPSNIATTTFLFIDDIVRQSPNGTPPAGFPSSTSINGQELNYGMDPDIVNNATWGPQLEAALTQVPSISVVMDIDDLLGSSQGIYTHAGNHGRSWERPISLELIQPDGSDGFQINAGLRIRGGFSRSNSNPKHAFRFFFRNEYGAGKLNFPLFGDEGVDEFDSVDLRTTQNYSWAFQGDGRNAFVRDVFSRDVQREMGQPYTRSRYYHLYINGQYWGLYQTQERSEASYAASYFGGNPEDYDVVKSAGSSGGYQNEATDGNMNAYQRLADYFYQAGGLSDTQMDDYWRAQGMNPDGTRNSEYERLLDVDNLIDYMIITYYTGDRDGPASRFVTGRVNNYFAIFNRETPDGFKFFEHDSEHSLGTGDSNMVVPRSQGGGSIQYFNPHWMHEQLADSNSEYRQRFSNRVYQHLFGDGPLTVDRALQLVNDRAAEFDLAMIAESARWGDSKRGTPFTKTDWENAVDSVRSFIQNRNATVIDQLRSQNWYAEVEVPRLTVNGSITTGGRIDPSDEISMFASASTSYQTIVETGSVWKYLADGSNQGTQWRESDYDDSSWPSGPAELGYGDGGEATTVPCSPTPNNCGSDKFITTYFRHDFQVDNPAQYQTLRVRLRRDDGAAVYLNGQEIARSNLNANADYDDFATGVVGGGDETTYFEFAIDQNLLVAGRNVLAVEVHQQNINSSDISFDLGLDGGVLNAGNVPIYYTLDGSDPRLIGGGVSPKAIRFDGTPFQLDGTRILNARTFQNNEWSPLEQAEFLVDEAASSASLRITEINYNPHEALLAFGEADVDNDEFEFVELMNTSSSTIDLTGVRFVQVDIDGDSNGIEFEFATQTLSPGERLVVVKNREAFRSRFGDDVRVAERAGTDAGTGIYDGSLRNSGEVLTLLAADGTTLTQFEYGDSGPWPGRADGNASSLEMRDVTSDDLTAANFRSSLDFGGSPGRAGRDDSGPIVINEIVTHTDLPLVDAIELHNTADEPWNIANWYVSDGSDQYLRYQISSAQPQIPAHGYLVIDENELGFGFRGETSDDAWLVAADQLGRPIYFADHVEFDATQNGTALGRIPNGTGELFRQVERTLGAVNSSWYVPEVVISEVHYAPSESADEDPLSTREREFVEILNHSANDIDISHWQLDDAIDFDVSAGTMIAPGERLVIVSFDPTVETAKAASFRQQYEMPPAARLLGPFEGVLDNAGDSVELKRPEDLLQLGLGEVLIDRVHYDPQSPWPSVGEADESLVRQSPISYGNDPLSWDLESPSPGSDGGQVEDLPGDFNSDGVVEFADINLLCLAIRSSDTNPRYDLNDDGVTSTQDHRYLIEQILETSYGDANLDGLFNSTDLVLIFQAGEYEDTIADNSSWATGDWNCDGEFNTSDLVVAFQTGAYTTAATPTAATSRTMSPLAAAIDAVFAEDNHRKLVGTRH